MSAGSIGDINREIAQRCSAMGLINHCGADGVFGAKVAIIAEAPGERERQIKQPLIGSSGKLFWDMVRPIGLTRRNCYVSNVVKRQLRAANDEKTEISRGEVDQYISILQWELSQLPNLELVVVLGNYALEALTGYNAITHHRGSVYDIQLQRLDGQAYRQVKVFATLNPAAVIREPKWEVLYKFDVGRLKNVLEGRYKQHTVSAIINPSFKEACSWIDKMHDEQMPVALDIESISDETACVGLANNGDEGLCINFRDGKSNRFTVQEELELRLRLQRFVSEPTTRLVMQNGMFDSYWLACKDRIMLKPAFFDTMLAHHTLYPTLPHNLGFLTSQYTTHPFYKDDGKYWREGGDINTFWEYNVKDCCITWLVYSAEHAELKAQNLEDFFFQHVMRLQPHLIRMTVGGVLVDARLKEKITEEMRVEVARLKQEFWDNVAKCTGNPDYKPNPGSPKQLRKLLFEDLRLVGRGVATDKKNRTRMKSHPKTTEDQRALLNSIDKYSAEKKFAGTYAESVIDEDGRYRCEYKQTGVQAAPGRLSSTQVMWGSGGNLQNQPGRAQKMYIADPGYGFSYFDLAQAEARVVAYRAVIHKWIEDFERARLEGGFDAHRSLAADMFKIPYDEVPTEDWEEDEVTPTIRYKAKRCRHGLNYTMGGLELAEQIGVSMHEGETLHNIYHRTNPELTKWWNWQYEQVRKTRVIYNAYGRRWINLERLDPNILGTIVAFYPQSTIGDKVSRCIYLCESDPEWPSDARMLLNIHDALVAIHRLEDGERVRRIMKRHAEEPLTIEGMDGIKRELIIPADLKKSVEDDTGYHRWSTLTKTKLEYKEAA